MDTCAHVLGLIVASNHSILNPSKWLCSECGTTEWVWACLSCENVACGRMNQQHALQHFETSKHPIAIEVNAKYVYCYVCDEYVVGDNAAGDLEALRSALTAIGTLSLEELQQRGGKLLRSYSQTQEISWSQSDDNDRLVTADCHYKKILLAKAFASWQQFIDAKKKEKATPSTSVSPHPPMLTRAGSTLFHVKKRTLIPGVTGMRNLGNTCYINSIIQALGHLEDFREFFCQLVFGLFSPTGTPLPGTSPSSPSLGQNVPKQLLRFNTVDYFQHLSLLQPRRATHSNKSTSSNQVKATKSSSPKKSGGLNGGGSNDYSGLKIDICSEDAEEKIIKAKADALKTLSLCQELHGLLRVLWSGKWAQVSPHGFLHAVWRAIPMFKGHSQHDAQEFLCELLDKLSREIEKLPQCAGSENIVDQNFRGELVSQVTCSTCNNTSSRHEPFLDLSLEFPRSFQYTAGQTRRHMCHITEMLSTFTTTEDLEPSSYACEKCNRKRKRRSRQQEEIKTNARKQLLISQPPEILRLHLKRFRWCGRNHREKIGTHVAFDEELDITPFCQSCPELSHYRLNAVVVHHGAGFRAGHYTTFTYNVQAESWVHCNDSRVQLVPLEDVLKSQAYILFYTRRLPCLTLDDMPVLTAVENSPDSGSTLSTIPDLDIGTMETLKQLSRGETEQSIDEEVSISFHRDPTLIRRLSSGKMEPTLKRAATLPNSKEEPSKKSPRKGGSTL
ncbi:ubiquitin carboxyl-terminal hydrolase 44-B [Aplysia californica]|uniref:Ubiquitin carboxyl-terminal hydrolase n=1 Tax=Aplysia californica TaxID=6500 RepID=A0ABM1A6Y3_APLCA|nr:ubiquitin carboxyl-terminal hydrolase 44-B [Aplysia californica]